MENKIELGKYRKKGIKGKLFKSKLKLPIDMTKEGIMIFGCSRETDRVNFVNEYILTLLAYEYTVFFVSNISENTKDLTELVAEMSGVLQYVTPSTTLPLIVSRSTESDFTDVKTLNNLVTIQTGDIENAESKDRILACRKTIDVTKKIKECLSTSHNGKFVVVFDDFSVPRRSPMLEELNNLMDSLMRVNVGVAYSGNVPLLSAESRMLPDVRYHFMFKIYDPTEEMWSLNKKLASYSVGSSYLNRSLVSLSRDKFNYYDDKEVELIMGVESQ